MNAVDALFTTTQKHVLRAVFTAGLEGISFRTIVEKAGGGYGGVLRVLDNLESAGLIAHSRQRNQKLYRADETHPLHAPLRDIVTKTLGVDDQITDVLEPFRDRIERAFIFGSFARRQEKAHSDIDVAIVGDISQRDLSAALDQAETIVGRPINVTIFGNLKDAWASASSIGWDPVGWLPGRLPDIGDQLDVIPLMTSLPALLRAVDAVYRRDRTS